MTSPSRLISAPLATLVRVAGGRQPHERVHPGGQFGKSASRKRRLPGGLDYAQTVKGSGLLADAIEG